MVGSKGAEGSVVQADSTQVARPVSLNGTPERGDKVLATAVAEPLQFADAWKDPK